MADAAISRRVLAWDGPTRLFKWSLVILVMLAPITQNIGDVTLRWHKINGYAILTLLLFRVLWGLFGGTTARFSSFVRSPGHIWHYLTAGRRGEKPRYLGHNPIGALMVLALMAALAAQGIAGLFTTDDILVEGPFYGLVSSALSNDFSVYHHYGFRIVIVLAVIHILANVYYTLAKDDNLIGAMVTGDKAAAPYVDHPQAEPGSWRLAAVCLVIAALIVFGSVWAFGSSPFA